MPSGSADLNALIITDPKALEPRGGVGGKEYLGT